MRSKFRMIWRLMEGERGRYAAAACALVLGSCVMYLVPLVPQVVLDGVLSPTPEKASPLVHRAVEWAGGRDALAGRLWWAAAVMVGLTAIAGLLTYLRGRWSAIASERIALSVRERLFDHLQHLPCSWHDGAETGDTVQRCTSDVETLRLFLSNQVVEIARAAFMLLVPLPLMWALDPRMTVVSVVLIPPIVAWSLFFFLRVQSVFLASDEAEGALTSRIHENLTGIRVVRAFGRKEYEEARFEERNTAYRDLEFRLYRLMAWFWSSSDVLCMGQKALVVAFGGWWLATGRIQVGTFYFFLAAVSLFVWPIRMMGRILAELGKAMVSIGRIGEILEAPRETEPADIRLVASSRRPPEIVFDRVSFGHRSGTKILEGVSFGVRSGEVLALLGPSGSGKSTIVNLLLRFYDPDAGSIRLDGRDITTIPRKEVRGRIAVVMQEPFLYSKSLRDNIRLGHSGAPEAEIVRAASAACIHDSIARFAAGYDTLVGERGVTLSGGQRQRVALARALLGEAGILVLDDALSAVDTDTEQAILDALTERKGRRTTIVIAHRLTTLRIADRIVVLEKGCVREEGTHADLLSGDGLYAKLWRVQSRREGDFHAEGADSP